MRNTIKRKMEEDNLCVRAVKRLILNSYNIKYFVMAFRLSWSPNFKHVFASLLLLTVSFMRRKMIFFSLFIAPQRFSHCLIYLVDGKYSSNKISVSLEE